MPHLSLSLLGGFKITLDSRPVTAFGTDKVRALLAYLAVESARPHRRALLAGMFWPELSEERAAHNLSQSLLRLRRALQNDKALAGSRSSFLLLTSQEVQFNPLSDYQLDVADFLELLRAYRQHKHADADNCKVCIDWLRQAADLYRGDILARHVHICHINSFSILPQPSGPSNTTNRPWLPLILPSLRGDSWGSQFVVFPGSSSPPEQPTKGSKIVRRQPKSDSLERHYRARCRRSYPRAAT